MNSSTNNDSFRKWRSKRERDPSETRNRKKLVTQEKINQRLNEKENEQQFLNKSSESKDNNLSPISLNKKLNENNDGSKNLPDNFIDQLNQQNDQMELTLQSNQTLKEKLVSLNNSKFVIEEDEKDEEIADLNDALNDSEYDYNGEDLSENDENYYANDYPDDHDYNELDYYRDYENDDEREMLQKFEKWVNDHSDYSENDDEDY